MRLTVIILWRRVLCQMWLHNPLLILRHRCCKRRFQARSQPVPSIIAAAGVGWHTFTHPLYVTFLHQAAYQPYMPMNQQRPVDVLNIDLLP